ncbi:MAG: flagellar hook assembly protein FlgD [Rhodospirillales bacterium]
MILDSSATATAATTATTGKAATDQTKLTGDLNRFLTLLVTQLQNQDPLQPLDANQFTAQLVQFASVEQQINQNANLEKLLTAQSEGTMASAVGYLGATVEVAGTALPLQSGSADASYTLPGQAKQAIAVVQNAAGQTVFTQAVDTAAGRHAFHWDGTTSAGKRAADGTYSLHIVAKSSTGDILTATQTWSGQVTGLGNGSSGTLLRIGSGSVQLADVQSITRPDAAAATN